MDKEVIDRTRHIAQMGYITKNLTSKCDLDLGGRDMSVAHDMLSHYGEYLC